MGQEISPKLLHYLEDLGPRYMVLWELRTLCGISISSTVFTPDTVVTNRQTDRHATTITVGRILCE